MRLRVLKVCCRLPLTCTWRPACGRPSVPSTTTVKATSPRTAAQAGSRKPTTIALGHRRRRCATVCVSPLGSAKLSSACRSDGPLSAGRAATTMRAAPCASVRAASLSATRRTCSAGASSSRLGSRGGSKLKSSKPGNSIKAGRSRADSCSGVPASGPPAIALSCAPKATCAGATCGSDGADRRASISGTRKASTRKLPLGRRFSPRIKATS